MTKELPGGYNGKILRVDLSDNRVSTENTDDIFCRKYLGGSGFISYFLLKEIKQGVDSLGPENKLIFALGPMVGTSVIGNGRNGIGAKSPLSNGIAFSQVGEFWGAELKKAGFDGIIVEGKANKPVYLWINDGEVSIKDAHHLWGKNTKETQEMIRSELCDEKIRVALIGPAGENIVRYACIMNGLYDAAGRGGLGAVMGSKKLKAIAVRGHQVPQISNPEGIKEFNKWVRDNLTNHWLGRELIEYGTGGPQVEVFEEMGNLPVRNWRDGLFPGVKKIHAGVIKDTVRIGMDACFSCPIRCKKRVKFDEPYFVDPSYGGPEYETLSSLGSNCGIDNLKAIIKGNELCNAYSLDTISTGGTIAFAMECFEKGLLSAKETDGIELRFGNEEAMLKCIELIARREGFGNLLAEGTARLAKKIGRGAEKFAMHVKGVEPGQHEPRIMAGFALGFMINPHGADHCCNSQDHAFAFDMGMRNMNRLGYHGTLPVNDISPRKVAVFRVEHFRQVLLDSFLLCHLALALVDYKKLVNLTTDITGWDTSDVELMRIAERTLTMARLFNMREGLTADDDVLPARYFQPKTDGILSDKALDPAKMERAKRYYYALMGWDGKGVPLPEKVEELSIE
jgi:aldehyde:ferredoxin oxidoreductase